MVYQSDRLSFPVITKADSPNGPQLIDCSSNGNLRIIGEESIDRDDWL